jgi:hypothetical protein
MLSSQVDMILKIDQETGNAEEIQNERKAHLEKLYRRHLSKCVGRGALTLGTQETIPTETLQIPTIS